MRLNELIEELKNIQETYGGDPEVVINGGDIDSIKVIRKAIYYVDLTSD